MANQLKALDCGAGIGRITKNVLLKFFEKVDLLDNCEHFLKEARNYIGPDEYDQRISTICSPLQKFQPTDGVQYDLIWIQWVIGHLFPDQQFIDFLNKCKSILRPHGLLMIKDNHTSTDDNDLDTQDGRYADLSNESLANDFKSILLFNADLSSFPVSLDPTIRSSS